ncbi:transcriptional regulator [Natronococcus pandeyae]|uniref:Transcriptional regulator n=1 Tax=Natronococcus pandeyae TaxID=2055836 RepID=A0A8J8Q1H8_9EURY|nr:helix-turn-helix domain-containing protein [Natronococcus pandeyae]TYL36693.1 transcriptional regulator [Natronococcus pandeyae]
MPLEFSSSDDAPAREHVLGVLTDDACREIIAVLEEPLTVPEVADEIERPLSTTYRKLDRLTDSGLVKKTGARPGREQKSRYVTDFDRIAIDLDDARNLCVDVDRSNDDSLALWKTDL